MIDSAILVVMLTVGVLLVVSIALNRVLPHIGSVLAQGTAAAHFPLSQTVPLHIGAADKPTRIIVRLNRSSGFYSGKIVASSGSTEVGRRELPVRPEYTSHSLKFFNEDIARQSSTIIVPVRHYTSGSQLAVTLTLEENVKDPRLRSRLEMTNEDQISIAVRGRRSGISSEFK